MINKDCFSLMSRLFNGELNQKQYYEGLMGLNIKYPMRGRVPLLTSYQIKNYRTVPVIMKEGKLKYLDHLQPFSFLEAAEMYHGQIKDKQYQNYQDKEDI